MRRSYWAAAGAAVCLLVALAGFEWRPRSRAVPTTRVKKGDLAIEVHATGELKPGRSAMLLAPQVPGTLQIVSIKPAGTRVQAGEVVIEFDPSEQEFNLEQARSELAEVEQQLAKEKAEGAIQVADDRVALIQARFAVRRAELEVGRNELLAAIDARKNVMALEEARRRLEQLEQDIGSRATSSRARMVVLEEKRQKVRLRMQQTEKSLEEMKISSPVPGFLAILENRSSDFSQPGMSLPEYRSGDLVWSGQSIALVAQPESMEILTKIDETDRVSIEPGQPVDVNCKGLPPQALLAGKVKRVASVPSRGFAFQTGSKKFDTVVELSKSDGRLRSGQTADVKVRARQLQGVLQVPRQAVFEKDGKTLVYVRSGAGFQPKPVKILYRSESTAALEGVSEGTEVALADPEASKGTGKPRSAASAPRVDGGGR